MGMSLLLWTTGKVEKYIKWQFQEEDDTQFRQVFWEVMPRGCTCDHLASILSKRCSGGVPTCLWPTCTERMRFKETDTAGVLEKWKNQVERRSRKVYASSLPALPVTDRHSFHVPYNKSSKPTTGKQNHWEASRSGLQCGHSAKGCLLRVGWPLTPGVVWSRSEWCAASHREEDWWHQ